MKNNILIAEFMGFNKDSEDLYLIDDYNLRGENEFQATYVNEMKFNSSWDWLMPVIKKCFQTGDDTHQWDNIIDTLFTCDIIIVYAQVIEFINLNKKNE